jgi:exopolysaccharide biosynthesis polyprenyl glycosylphosphotransferase
MGLTWAFALGFELGSRRVWRWLLHRWRADGTLSYRTLIVGTGEEASLLTRSLAHSLIGHISSNGSAVSHNGIKVVGRMEKLAEVILERQADCLFVASTEVSRQGLSHLRSVARRTGVELHVSANLPQMLSTGVSLQPAGDVFALSLRRVRLSGPQAAVKRFIDVAASAAGLMVAAPLLGVIALAVKLTSAGPVLFTQERVTGRGRTFTMYKFRTMANDADRIIRERDLDRSEAFFKPRESSPVTGVGRLLRRLSLDELPQLWNVLKGDMSLVGPRPLPVEQVAANLELLEYRHEVRAGLTGWWQINGRSDVDPVDAVRMDLFYIENWSLALDLYIVLKTFGALLARKGAY